MSYWRVAQYALIGAALITMPACLKIPGKKPPPAPPPPAGAPAIPPRSRPLPVNLTLLASATVNPSESNRPSPIVVRVYQLKNETTFRAAAYDRLYEDDQAVLSPDLIERALAVTLRPGEKTTVSMNFGDDVRFIGIAAFYRDYDNAQWRVVIPAPLKGDGTILVDKSSVSFSAK